MHAMEPMLTAVLASAKQPAPVRLTRPVLAIDLLRRLFLSGPGDEVVALVFAAADLEGGPPGLVQAIERMRVAAESGLDGDEELWLTELAAEFTRLVIGPQSTPAVPYASYYLSPTRQVNTEETVAVRRRYLDASVSRRAELGLPDDQVGIELDFLYHLMREEARALTEGDHDCAAAYERQRNDFLTEHFARWVPQFAQALRHETTHAFMLGVADALAALAGRPSC